MSFNGENKVINDNLKKLKELSDKLCDYDTKDIMEPEDLKNTLLRIKQVVESEEENLKSVDKDKRLKGYERMCFKLNIILNKLKLT